MARAVRPATKYLFLIGSSWEAARDETKCNNIETYPFHSTSHTPRGVNPRYAVAMKHPGVTATVREIAAEAGVSIATVSRVLNGQANVTAQTREQVRIATERLNGRPRVYRLGTKAVYVRCPYVLTDYFGLIVSSIAESLDRHGLQLVLNAGEPAQTSHPLLDLPGRAGLGGAIIILPPEETDEIIA